jgi:hypothetical protein
MISTPRPSTSLISAPGSGNPHAPIYKLRGLVAIVVGIYCIQNASASMDVLAKIFCSFLWIEAGLHIVKIMLILCHQRQGDCGDVYYNIAVGVIVNGGLAFSLFLFPRKIAGIFLLVVCLWVVFLGFEELRQSTDNGRECCSAPTSVVVVAYVCVILFYLTHLHSGQRTAVELAGSIILIFGLQLVLAGFRLQYGFDRRQHLSVRNNNNNPENNPLLIV